MTPAVAPHPAKPETTPWFHKLYHLLFPQKKSRAIPSKKSDVNFYEISDGREAAALS